MALKKKPHHHHDPRTITTATSPDPVKERGKEIKKKKKRERETTSKYDQNYYDHSVHSVSFIYCLVAFPPPPVRVKVCLEPYSAAFLPLAF